MRYITIIENKKELKSNLNDMINLTPLPFNTFYIMNLFEVTLISMVLNFLGVMLKLD